MEKCLLPTTLQKNSYVVHSFVSDDMEFCSSLKNEVTRMQYAKLGWSNFCTLVGHFSKLFEFAGLSRLKTLIFVFSSQNHSVLQKKGLHLDSVSEIPIFVAKS